MLEALTKIKLNDIKKPFWGLEVSETAEILGSDTDKGLEEKEASSRLGLFGSNSFGKVKVPSVFSIFIRQFQSPLIIILIFASIATIVLREWADASIIILAVAVNTFLGFYQERKAERAIADLSSYIQECARVIRDGKEMDVDASTLVPGDLIRIFFGMRVPADARVVSVQSLSMDESILTGESTPVAKETGSVSEAAIVTERKSMLFGGTFVAEGSVRAIVTATGSSTEIGKIAQLVAETRQERTPLQKAVFALSWIIAIGISLIVTGIFALGVSRGEPIVDMFVVSIAVVVGAIPEALPVGLTAVLAIGIQRIARRKGIMRNLVAAETLGSTSVVMVDKTGTLTEAKMKLTDIVVAGELMSPDVVATSGDQIFSDEQKELLRLGILNTDVIVENSDKKSDEWQISGRALEANIVREAVAQGINIFEGDVQNRNRMVLPFSSSYKFSVAKKGDMLIIMGAPDVLLARSEISKDDYVAMMKQIEEMSEHGRRVLGIATLQMSDIAGLERIRPDSLKGLVFKGLLGFHDPVRKDVPETLRKIKNYGVNIVMATGDLKGTAVAVANEIGWDIKEGQVLTGEELRGLDDKALLEVLSHTRIFARVTPEDKLRIVMLYKKSGEVAAMTGDGVNDAPSLKAADIGIAVGSGSDVAKGIADLVLLDDKLSTIVAAIEEGKRMIMNIRKIFVYLMSNSLDEVILIGGALLAGLALPLTAVQIIWVNLFTGSLPAIGFAFEKDGDLERLDRSRSGIIDNEVKFLTIGIGIFTSVLLFVLYWLMVEIFSVELTIARNVLFMCFASYILAVAFSLRSLRRPLFSYPTFDNRFLSVGVALGFALLAATMYLPLLHKFFGTAPVPPIWLILVVGWLILNIALVEGAKFIFYTAEARKGTESTEKR
ncbi:MAG: HAD-IC family P-type ATPase [Candidatus Yanofskybacteria bacterium]|nr:HAD-IC family P-type ATPase [Candidatus Yanofskybacteria bacterium]